MRNSLLIASLSLTLTALLSPCFADPLPIVHGLELQPLQAGVKRVVQALDLQGSPLQPSQQAAIDKALASTNAKEAADQIQAVLDPLCLAEVDINPESRVKVLAGPAPAKLVQQGWRTFLIKVHNQGGVTAQLRAKSPNADPLYTRSSGRPDPRVSVKPNQVGDRWMDLTTYDKQPLNQGLSGLPLEYRILQIYSRDVGRREGKLVFDVGQGTQDLGFRNELNLLFACEPAVEVTLEVIDDDGQPTTGQFVFRDEQERVYPSLARRLAPDFFFHSQIYRHNGESVMLPPGKYQVLYSRGPEYREQHREITVPKAVSHKESFRLKRWIKMSDYGWYSGDHHIHAAGCAHYESPSEGVQPADMMRHILGEDLDVGCVLSWGPCWYFQKQYFEGKVNKLSTPRYLMRYDVEVSGFPSSHAGHLCLLNLKADDYAYPKKTSFDWNYDGEKGHFEGTKTERIGEWPSWDLPVLKWGKAQGAVVGFSHSGPGLQVSGNKLPTYEMPKFDGIGANEYIVDVVHGACDFISAVDTPSIWELNIWYHTLNCGYTTRISGETDFPCVYGERVGLGRAYVKLASSDADKKKPLDYDRWADGIRDGRSYVSDGLSHLFDFSVGSLGVGEKGADGRTSVLAAKAGEPLEVRVRAAALLADKPREDIRSRQLNEKPYWHVERARIKDSNKVPVELIVNGQSVETQELTADGTVNDLKFKFKPERSSWVAFRIFPTSHTNPVFVEVDGKPIRASKRSAQWCLDACDVCWKQKVKLTRVHEQAETAEAYEVARDAYRKILKESADDTGVDGAGFKFQNKEGKELLSKAAEIPADELAVFLDGKKNQLDDYDNQTLTLFLLFDRPALDGNERRVEEFSLQPISGQLDPQPILEALKKGRKAPSFLHPEYIKKLVLESQDAETARGTVEFLAEGAYQGKVAFVARKHNESWRVERFVLPVRGVTVELTAANKWRISRAKQ